MTLEFSAFDQNPYFDKQQYFIDGNPTAGKYQESVGTNYSTTELHLGFKVGPLRGYIYCRVRRYLHCFWILSNYDFKVKFLMKWRTAVSDNHFKVCTYSLKERLHSELVITKHFRLTFTDVTTF